MAEILIWLQNCEGQDIYYSAKLPQRGDLITVHEDGWVWGTQELSDQFVRVIVPDAGVTDFDSLLAHEMPQPGNEHDEFMNFYNTLQFRGFKLDVDAYTGGVLRSGTTVPYDEVMALKVQRPPLPDPKVIGKSDKVIG